ncbi:ionotropic receptor 40a [Lutzomyia longipalpis]|uniref:ionotropic receptor 40a n=1 Tax=Lutzomyia longipalpis TaxID=7200 RepID=UPI002483ACD4|nr:ionotropic receptor 40a [Lutzomyia longipalpis]
MRKICALCCLLILFPGFYAFLEEDPEENSETELMIGLVEIVKSLDIKSLVIFYPDENSTYDINKFIIKVHERQLKSAIFFNSDDFFSHIESCMGDSLETTSLIFSEPSEIVPEIQYRVLDHRLNLFIFYWGSHSLPRKNSLNLKEPLKVVILTTPRPNVLRIYYNQATPDGKGILVLVNWYDGNSLGLFRFPVLPEIAHVYSDFDGRVLIIPVIHSPPWHFVVYQNETIDNETYSTFPVEYGNMEYEETPLFKVVGGRDDNLLKLLAKKMNFTFKYIDPPERTQGSAIGSSDNLTFSGGLGLLQRREANLLLGDIAITSERSKAVEFSFFTLVDSGAFVTHAPRRLSEALALVRPFRMNVWPALILTVIASGPVLYLVIIVPQWWRKSTRKVKENNFFHHIDYIDEMNYGVPRRLRPLKPIAKRRKLPQNLLERCIWFTINLFLKQSACLPYGGNRARFVSLILWLSATYILGDFYSAQLTSQLARPAREAPINDLYRLEAAMKWKGYELYVERQSASLAILENGTEIFHRLHSMMMAQNRKSNESYLISSIEEGVYMVMMSDRKVVLGGRETLFFNMKRYGVKKFQLSEKLYTRYSAVAVPNGCPFLDILNNILIRLFESGILDRMTNKEYEKMFESTKIKTPKQEIDKTSQKPAKINFEEEHILKPVSLKLLQGAFYTLLIGYILSGIVLLLECEWKKPRRNYIKYLIKFLQKIWCYIKNISLKCITFIGSELQDCFNEEDD